MRKNVSYELTDAGVGMAVRFIEKTLRKFGFDRKTALRSTLVAEESMGSLVAHAHGKGMLRVSIRKFLGNVTVEISAPGAEYSLADNMSGAGLKLGDDVGPETQDVLRNILLHSFGEDLKYRHRDGYNWICITLARSGRRFLYVTLLALFSAIVIGLVLGVAAPAAFNTGLDRFLLTPVKTVYMKLLRMVVAPVVFFSIVSCISGFSSLRDLGKIGGRTLLLYTVTTVIAVVVGIGSFYLFRPGEASMAAGVPAGNTAAAAAETAQMSIGDMFLDMVPSNVVEPFLNNSMPQLIFLAVFCGIATGMIGKYSRVLQPLFEACNELFMKMSSILMKLMPVAVFCSTASLILVTGVKTMLPIMAMFGTFVFGLVCMMAVYILMIILVGRLNPRPFLIKYAPTMLQNFSMASSNAAIPLNLKACEKQLGISSRVCGLSIPLGSTLNMDGTCVQLAVFALTLANVYGVKPSPGSLVILGITIIILSMGMPGIPGAGVICLTVLLQQLQVPTESVSLVMGIAPLVGMFLCMSNCTGDVVVTAIVARSAGEIDLDVYKA